MTRAWFWKMALTLTICFSVWVNYDISMTEPIPFRGSFLEYEPGVKAAIFALTSAALFIVSWIRTDDALLGVVADWFNRLASAITAVLTGWYWLVSATPDKPAEHLAFVTILTIIVVASVVVVLPLVYLCFGIGQAIIVWFRGNRS